MQPLSSTPPNLSALYEQDYYLWLEATVHLLKHGQLGDLDRANLLEELADMGRSEKRAVYSTLKILLVHLLKYKYQPSQRSNSWRASIVEHRQRLQKAFQESPSLKSYFAEMFDECYRDATELATAETGMDACTFPIASPFETEEVLGMNFLPD